MDLAVSPRRVSPLPDTIRRNVIASAAGNVGDLIYIAPDFGARPTNAALPDTAGCYGVVVSTNCEGAIAFDVGDALSVVTHGPVAGFVATAPGSLFVSNTPGKIADAAGTVSRIIGRVEKADVIYISPVAA